MSKTIFVNLPVSDLDASMTFYKSIGFENNPEFTDATAAANGGIADVNPVQDLGFMYNRNLADPDGHVWEAMWMNPAAIPRGNQTS